MASFFKVITLSLMILLGSGFLILNAKAIECRAILSPANPQETILANDALTFLNNLDKALIAADNYEPKVTREDLKTFDKMGSTLKLLQNIRKFPQFIDLTNLFGYWITVDLFQHPESETEEINNRYNQLFNKLFAISRQISPDFTLTELVQRTSKKKFSQASKVLLIRALKTYSVFFSRLLQKDVNLLLERELLDLLDTSDRAEFRATALELEAKNRDIEARLERFNKSNLRSFNTIVDDYNLFFFAQDRLMSTTSDRTFFASRGPDGNEVVKMLQYLNLPEELEMRYLADSYVINKTLKGKKAFKPFYLRALLALVIVKASMHVFNPKGLAAEDGDSVLARAGISKPYLAIKTQITNYQYVSAAIEERMTEFLEKADQVNSRINSLRDKADRILRLTQALTTEVEPLLDRLNRLEILDIGEDQALITQAEAGLRGIEYEFDLLMESALKDVRNENISNLLDLNNRWSRLIPDKVYAAQGVDYTSVTFDKPVVDFFRNDPLRGTRFLAALSKSYVAVKNASGLRHLPNIHSDFRDIKVIKKRGKIRIIGKLIGNRIHFFHVYDSDKPYKNAAIKSLIKNYKPVKKSNK